MRIIYPKRYRWIDIIYIGETPKAILIAFDDREAWIPKVWIHHIKLTKGRAVIARRAKPDEAISIKISEYCWAKKFT